ncbi:neurotactin [Plutella xylostella]|uniref:neurotactin n=1 Tax=Plutella xylostella TaxID=51655 RepID=UPI0020330FB3|nr:neurotactin [Plutella xylostella]
MSTTEVNKIENEDDNKTPDKKQIEAEEKEMMLKSEAENIVIDASEKKGAENEGPVKAALSQEFTDQGREVKPKFIPIGAIKMPGFFTRNSDKEKSKDEDGVEKEGDTEKADESAKPRHRLQFLHACPFTQFMHHPKNEDGTENAETKRGIRLPNIKYPKFLQKKSDKDAEATLASMETLEDKLDTPNDGMENVKLDGDEVEGKVATKLPLKERIRQKKFIMDDIVVCVVVVLVLLAVIIGVVIGARAGPPAERPLRLGRYMTTITSCGPVEGIYNEGVYSFYNIPYAVPPVGERRFAYAAPLDDLARCWNGSLAAHAPGPACLQLLANGTVAGDEACLALDVVTPHVRYDAPLPVVVLVGATTLAGGLGPLQPSALYARTKEVVFVRPNFRLGPFGFLALDSLSKTKYPETSGNYALSDLLVALEWVKHNIKHFGGDESSVTLLGHRAGATLVAALTTVKKAQKLYSRVWLSSPSVIFPGEPLEQAVKANEQFKLISKCSDADCLRQISATELLAATPDVWLGDGMASMPRAGELRRSWLVLDGDLLRQHAYEAWDAQKKAKQLGKEKEFKPMVFGTTRHSGHSELLQARHLNWTAELVEREVSESVLGERNLTAAVFQHFNKTYAGLVELMSAVRTLCPLVSLARLRLGAPLYVASAGGGRLAAADADVRAILGTFDSDTPEQRRFMASMQHMFYYYVGHGALPASEPLLLVEQDPLPLPPLPACDLLIQADVVPRFAHVD